MKEGFIKLFRQLLNWEWYTDIPVKVLFLHFLLKANHRLGKWRGVEIYSGQFVTSIDHLAKETGLTVRQVRTALNKLKTTSEVTIKTTSRYSLISINNWDKWQTNDKQFDKQATNKRQTNDKQATTNKNEKNDKNEKNEKEKKNIGLVCNLDFEKCFKFYSENCKNLLPLNYERRSRAILEELNQFLTEIDYDFEYFAKLCKTANELEKIVENKIDFRSMIRNHIGIMNGKYTKTNSNKKGVSPETIKRCIAEARAKMEVKSG